jgi:hypothetical protein
MCLSSCVLAYEHLLARDALVRCRCSVCWNQNGHLHRDSWHVAGLKPLGGAQAPSVLQYAEIVKLIDVERPYYALFDVTAPSTLQTARVGMPVSGKFCTESAKGPEEHIPIGVGELGRHCAVLGSIACAAANPVKRRHYYLAARASLKLMDDLNFGKSDSHL